MPSGCARIFVNIAHPLSGLYCQARVSGSKAYTLIFQSCVMVCGPASKTIMAYGELSSNSSFGLSGNGGPAVAAALIVQTPTTARTTGNKRIATPGGRAKSRLPWPIAWRFGWPASTAIYPALGAVAWAAWAGWTCKEPRGFCGSDVQRLANKTPGGKLPGVSLLGHVWCAGRDSFD